MLEGKWWYQLLQVAGAIAGILLVLGLPVGWYFVAMSAPVTSNMSQATNDIAGIRAQLNKVSDKLDAIPDQRAWTASSTATEQNRTAIEALRDRVQKDELQWTQTSTIVNSLSDGTLASTRRSRP